MVNSIISNRPSKAFDDRLNIIKGILVLCVVIEHNLEIEDLYPRIKIIFESFDVFGFFLIAFCFPARKLSFEFFKDRAFRYLVPFFWYYSLSSLIYNFFIIKISMSDFSINYSLGLLFLSTPFIKSACGFALYWFLPCYLAITIIRSIYASNSKNKIFLIVISLSFHFVLTNMLAPYIKWIPLSLSVALYCFPVCLFFEIIWKHLGKKTYFQILCFFLFVFSLSLIGFYKEKFWLFASILPSVNEPEWLLIGDVCALSSIPALYWFSSMLNLRILSYMGKYSICIYLTHNLVYYVIKYNFKNLDSPIAAVLTALFTILGAILVTYLITHIIIFQKLIFPRNVKDWKIYYPAN